MAVLRSAQLGVGKITSPSTAITLLAVPAGYRAILRDLRLYNAAASSATLVIPAMNASGGTAVVALFFGPIAANAVASVVCDAVLVEGDTVTLYSDTADVHAWLSGALLPVTP